MRAGELARPMAPPEVDILTSSSSIAPNLSSVGAGVLALPATTAASGFTASSIGLIGAWAYSIGECAVGPRCLGLRLACGTLPGPHPSHCPIPAVTGLLVAEVNLSTLCELGAGRGVSMRCGLPPSCGAACSRCGAHHSSLGHLCLPHALSAAQWRGGHSEMRAPWASRCSTHSCTTHCLLHVSRGHLSAVRLRLAHCWLGLRLQLAGH